jgi:hypothetical protein
MAEENSSTTQASPTESRNTIERDDTRELSLVSQERVDELRSKIAEIDWNADPKGHAEVMSELKEVAVQNWYVAADVWRSSAPDVPPPSFLDATKAEAFELRNDAAERGIYRDESDGTAVGREGDTEFDARRKRQEAERTHVEPVEHSVGHLPDLATREPANERDARNPANDGDIGRESAMSEAALSLLASRRQNDLEAARRSMGLDGNRDDVAPARDTRATAQQEAAPEQPAAKEEKESATRETAEKGAVPKSVGKKFIQADNTFYFRDAENRVAFEDRGRKMVTDHNHPEVVSSMVDMAESKGWSKLKVAGHDDFKRQVWLEASMRGIEVSGFTPKDVDLAKLAELQQAQRTNSIAQDTSREPERAAGDTGRSAAVAQREQRVQEAAEKGIAGVLIEHGAAPYLNDPENKQSYYVKYRDAKGQEQTTWGVDLQRAIGESGAKIGDNVKLENLGKQWVSVEVPVKDKAGKVIGTEPKEVHRNTWDVQVEGMKQVLKEKGYSPTTIDAAVKTANAQLSERAQAGQPIPKMRIHDSKAPTPARQRTVTKQPEPSKEKEPAR